ncbi:MAG: hypothetical protein E7629_08620 [Ruminococcaceae bacterium]|nr:hypothetical protein [Oscillospiraceae bacterium]
MKQFFYKHSRFFCRAVYLMPLVVGVLLLALALIPHLFFVYDGEIHETMSPIALVNNTWEVCKGLLDSTSDNPYAVFFSYIMTFFVILFWILAAAYAVFALVVGICSLRAFSASPTDRVSNRAKRWMHLLCPNRVCYAIFGLLPIFPSFFPYILTHFYYTRLGAKMHVFFIGLPDPVYAIGLVLILELGFFLTLHMQARSHTDMFRLYKKKPKETTQNSTEDESCSTEK